MPITCPHCGKTIEQTQVKPTTFSEEDLKRFWSKVVKTESGCWISSAIPSGTYARLYMGGRLILAHVASYLIHHGAIPPGAKICHSCDTPRCVRPDHLEAKSGSENMQDMVARARHKPRFGALNNLTKLSDSGVIEIKQALVAGVPIKEIAEKHGVSFQAIYQIARGRSRKSVGPTMALEVRPCRKLSREDVLSIRDMNRREIKQKIIASVFGIWPATVSQIVRGVKRKDVPICH